MLLNVPNQFGTSPTPRKGLPRENDLFRIRARGNASLSWADSPNACRLRDKHVITSISRTGRISPSRAEPNGANDRSPKVACLPTKRGVAGKGETELEA